MTNEELLQKFKSADEFEITGNDRLSDGTYKFFKGSHPATADYLFIRKKSVLGTFKNAPYTMNQAAHLKTIIDEWVELWVEMGDTIFILKSQIKFL